MEEPKLSNQAPAPGGGGACQEGLGSKGVSRSSRGVAHFGDDVPIAGWRGRDGQGRGVGGWEGAGEGGRVSACVCASVCVRVCVSGEGAYAEIIVLCVGEEEEGDVMW